MEKIFFILILILVVVIAAGLIYYFYFAKKGVEKPEKTEVPTSTPPKISLPKTLYNLTGAITKIEIQSITFEAIIPLIDENGQPIQKTEIRKAITTLSTTFTKMSFVEVEEKRKKPVETQITLKDLRVGDLIEAVSNQDISQSKEFEATQIRVLPH